jgi:spore photoproduct lyase
MFQSAHWVWFVNFEDFAAALAATAARHGREPVMFFSGYDCDSLALDRWTRFCDTFLDRMDEWPNASLELRTKSTEVSALLARPVDSRVVVAFSLAPARVAREVEHGAPPLAARLAALELVARAGWPIGLRFDPIVFERDFAAEYRRLFDEVFSALGGGQLHSVSFGALRFPAAMHAAIAGAHPRAPVLAGTAVRRDSMVSYSEALEDKIIDFCRTELRRRVPAERLFACTVPRAAARAEAEGAS